MTTRRRAIDRGHQPRLTEEMRAKAERLLRLCEDHADAIRSGDQSFYTDGRHQALVDLGPELRRALGIKPWHDEVALLRAALGIDED